MIREYEPTINYPDVIFTPSNQPDADFCWGTTYDNDMAATLTGASGPASSGISPVKSGMLLPITASTPEGTYAVTFSAT